MPNVTVTPINTISVRVGPGTPSEVQSTATFFGAESQMPYVQRAMDTANSANVFAQTALATANASYNYANTQVSINNGVNLTQNSSITSAYAQANTGTVLAQTGFNYANTQVSINNGVNLTQNSSITSAFNKANTIGTIGTQNYNLVTITGGNIDNTWIGNTAPVGGIFTTLTANGQVSLGGVTDSESFRVLTPVAAAGLRLQVGVPNSTVVRLGPAGSTVADFRILAPTFTNFYTGSSSDGLGDGSAQMRISHTASAVNYVQVTGSSTTSNPIISVQGSDAARSLQITSKGSTFVYLQNNSGAVSQFSAGGGAGAVNYFNARGAADGSAIQMEAIGTSTNVSAALISKGTGAIDLAAGSSGVNISNGGTVTALTRTSSSGTYTSIPSVAISVPTTAGGVQAAATVTSMLQTGNSPTIAVGGTSYTVGDVLTVVGGTPSSAAATMTVTTVSSGVITGVNYTNFAAYTTLPTNPFSVTGGTGTGATFNSTWYPFTFTIGTAGSGYVEQPTVTFSGGGGSGAAAYATVGGTPIIRSLGTNLSFYTPAGEQLRLTDNGVSSPGFLQLFGSASGLGFYAGGPATVSMTFVSKGATGIIFATNSTSATQQFAIAHTASAVNYVQVTGGSTGNIPQISAQGSDTNISLAYNSKGFSASHRFLFGGSEALRLEQFGSTGVVNRFSMFANISGGAPMFVARGTDTDVGLDLSTQGAGAYRFYTNAANNGTGAVQFYVAHTTSAVNYVQITGGATGSSPIISVQGSDTNVTLAVTSKGTSNVNFFTNGAAARHLQATHVAGTLVNFVSVSGSATTAGPVVAAAGTDTNISMALQSKGTGAIDLAAGSSGVNISNGGTVTAITITANGANYTTPPMVAITAPTTAGGVQATATCVLLTLAVVTVNAGGTGYTVNDVLTLSAGTFTVAATYTVTAVSGGVVTAVSASSRGAYTVTPTTPAATTGGTGTGATLTPLWGVSPTLTITNAGSGYVEQPTVTFSGGGGSSAAAYATVGGTAKITGIGAQTDFYTPSGAILSTLDGGLAATGAYLQLTNSSASNSINRVIGSGTNLGLYWLTKGTSSHAFATNNSSATVQFQVTHTASAVNYVQVTGAATGSGVSIQPGGSDSTIGLNLSSKGSSSLRLYTNSSANAQLIIPHTASSVNYQTITGSATGYTPIHSVAGTDANIGLAIQTVGTGAIDLAAGSSGVNISNGGTVTAITRTAGGSTYTSVPTVAITAPTTAGGVQAVATATVTLSTGGAAIASGGTGYTVSDLLTVSSGTGTAIQLTVATVSSGVITSVTITNFGSYSIAPTNPVSVTGGTGSSATFNLSYGVNTVFNITTAGSGYVEQPTVTFSGGGGSAAAAYATVGSGVSLRSLGGGFSFFTPNQGEAFRVYDFGGSTWVGVRGHTSGTAPAIFSAGTANVGLDVVSNGTSPVTLRTGGTVTTNGVFNQITQFNVAHTASAVNYVQVTGGATGVTNFTTISSQGSDTNVNLALVSKGSGYIAFGINAATTQAFRVLGVGSSTGNLLAVSGSAAGAAPSIQAISGTSGTDTNIDLALTPKGTGVTTFGSQQANYWTKSSALTTFTPVTAVAGSDTNISMALQPKGTGAIDLAAGSSGVNISNGGTVTAITRTAAGSAYTTLPSIVISSPTTAGGVQATASCTIATTSGSTLAGGGTGYTVADTLTVVGGTFTTTATFTVATVSAGVITGITLINGGAYTVFPTNPVSVTGGTGSGATINFSAGVINSTFTITAAGSGYVEQPTVTFSGGGGSGAAAYATVGSGTIVRSLGSSLSFTTPGGEVFRVSDRGLTTVNYVSVYGNNANNGPEIRTEGTASALDLQFVSKSTGSFRFFTQGTSYAEQLRVTNTTSAVNYVQVTGGATGGQPNITAQGSDAAIGLTYRTKGNFNHQFQNGSIQICFEVAPVASTANYVRATSAIATASPILSAQGSDTNIDLALTPKGNGSVRIVPLASAAGLLFAQDPGNSQNSARMFFDSSVTNGIMGIYNSAGTLFINGSASPGVSTGTTQVKIATTINSVNHILLTGSLTTVAPSISAQGSDTNVDLALTPKGTGAVLINSILGLNAVTASTTATTADQVLATFNATLYRTVKFVIQSTDATNYHSTEILAIHNGTTASYTEYATVTIGTACATYSVDYSSATIRLLATPASATATTYKIAAQLTRI